MGFNSTSQPASNLSNLRNLRLKIASSESGKADEARMYKTTS